MRKKLLMALLMTTAALFAGIGGYAINGGAASKTEWSNVAMEQTYRFGDIVSVPDCELSYEGEIYSGEKTVIYPSGKVLTGDTFVASESGKYVVRYQVEVNGNILEKEFYIEDHAEEIRQLEKELHNIIDYDEWAGKEFGETKVDYYWTAVNLLKAGYRKIETESN